LDQGEYWTFSGTGGYDSVMSKAFSSIVITALALSSFSCSSSSKGGTGTGDAGTMPNNTGNGGSSNSNVDGGTNPSNGGSSNGSSGSSNGGSSNGGSSNGGSSNGGGDGLCGDTTNVDTFFESHRDIQIPLVYDDGMTGDDYFLEPGWKLDFVIIGEDKSVILVEPPGGTMQLGSYNAATDTYEDTAQEVNLMLDPPEFGYDVIVQCTKATGDFTVVMTANNDRTIWTRWVSE
jgi:hypothetical protein